MKSEIFTLFCKKVIVGKTKTIINTTTTTFISSQFNVDLKIYMCGNFNAIRLAVYGFFWFRLDIFYFFVVITIITFNNV